MVQDPVYLKIAFRTMGIAVAVTLTDIVLAFPLAYYAARLASPRMRSAVLVAVVLPLWSSYLVRVFAWRTVLQDNGPADWLLRNVLHVGSLKLGFTNWAIWLTFVYLWLPFTTLPIYAALERIPQSYLEASGDLGGRGWNTFRRVILPLALPGIVAGSIFAFSLTLGDYIAPILVGNTKFIGNVVHDFSGVANNVPFAAAYALVPVVIIGAYLLFARRLGAFEAL
jgi:putative spermidine/putrescine transport system permease protein